MKFQLKNIAIALVATLTLTSCSNDDDVTITANDEGSIVLKFDNIYAGADFAFDTQYTHSNGEKIKTAKAKYIVSKIVLTRADGSSYTIPKSESYFIVDEATSSSTFLTLPKIPAGDYTQVKFGIGVDEAQWQLGVEGQGNFWAQAQAAGMEWGWTAGYRHVVFEGSFTSATNVDPINFQAHTGRTAQNYNYTEITLTFPDGDKALVRTSITPQVHIMADLSKILDGENKINLAEGAGIHGGNKTTLITQNVSNMFSVHHVHND
jgi:hypothetical protein